MRGAENRCVRSRRRLQYVSGRSTERSWATTPDVAGILAALRQLGADGAGSWLLLGTGGSARAVAVAAATAKADLHVLSRDARAGARLRRLGPRTGDRAEAARGKLEPDIAINATPAGLKDSDPLPLDRTARHVCGPPRPRVRSWRHPLGTHAERGGAGVRAQDGREVLVHQGAAAFSASFPEHAAPLEVMRAAVNRALGGVRRSSSSSSRASVCCAAPSSRSAIPPGWCATCAVTAGAPFVRRGAAAAGNRAVVRPLPALRRVAGRVRAGAIRGVARRGAREAVHALKYGGLRASPRSSPWPWSARRAGTGLGPSRPRPAGARAPPDRGYNQSERLARALGRRWRRPVVDLLVRTRDTARKRVDTRGAAGERGGGV